MAEQVFTPSEHLMNKYLFVALSCPFVAIPFVAHFLDLSRNSNPFEGPAICAIVALPFQLMTIFIGEWHVRRKYGVNF